MKRVLRSTMAMSAALVLLHFSPAARADQWCQGLIRHVLTDASGNVMAVPSFRGDWVQVCSISAAWKGISVDICKSWLGTLTALSLTQRTTTMFYSGDTACNAIPSYGSAPAPGYIAINPE